MAVMKHSNIGQTIKIGFGTTEKKKSYYTFKILYRNQGLNYVTEVDWVPMDEYWISTGSYLEIYDIPGMTFCQSCWYVR